MIKKVTLPYRVISIGQNNSRYTIACRYLNNIETVPNLTNISWKDIIFRRVRLISIPSRQETKTLESQLKRKVIRLLRLCVSSLIFRLNADDCLLEDHGKKVLFAPADAVIQIYSTHLGSDFSILEFKDEIRSWRLRHTRQKINKLLKQGLVDLEHGLTVFTNVRNDTSIRLYKRFHPNRKIILRYHDILDGGLGSRSPSIDQLLKMTQDLRSDGIVDEIESYYQNDAKILNGFYRPNGVDPKIILSTQTNMRNALYRFRGGPKDSKDTSRLDVLNDLRHNLRLLYPNIDNYIFQKLATGSSQWISYTQYLQEIAASEIVIDLTRNCQNEGFSFRIAEALFLNKKIITNRLIVLNEPFYSPERVFLIGYDSYLRLGSFLQNDLAPLPESILSNYNSRLWWTDQDPLLLDEKN